MSERFVVEFEHVGKMYRLYRSRLQSFLDATSLGSLAPRWNSKIDNFWALRNVSFRLKAGSRLGIVGRNGAGKTTLLKLMTGNITPTEGQVTVRGEVQALLEAGAGFHPEFSGYENIEASLTQNGFSRSQIKAAIDEIADFTELGDFLRQPFKTYSAGMQARLVFTTATTVKPDILIIDEILGAGDGYFAAKSRGRMRALVESGASVLLVSHALDQILQFCDEAIWLERGRIILRGPSMEVVKAYEEFVHDLQERQLKASNRQRKLGFRDGIEIGHFNDNFVVALSLTGPPGSRADINTVELRCEELAEETLRVGDTQDSDTTYLSYVALANCQWGDPQNDIDGAFRSLDAPGARASRSLGEMVFRSYALEPDRHYTFRIRYRVAGEARLTATVSRNGRAIITDAMLPADGVDWQAYELPIPEGQNARAPAGVAVAAAEQADIETAGAIGGTPVVVQAAMIEPVASGADAFLLADADSAQSDFAPAGASAAQSHRMAVRRWSGEGSLLIEEVILRDGQGNERAIFPAASPLTICLHYRAARAGVFPVVYTVAVYRIDGIKVTQHVSEPETVTLGAKERRSTRLEFPSMDLADGRYVISVALHRDLDPYRPGDTVRYDLLDRSYEFEITGNPPLRSSLFVLPARWVGSSAEP